VATPNKINSNNREKNRHRQERTPRGIFPTCDNSNDNDDDDDDDDEREEEEEKLVMIITY
jgi:hypothetical protein